MTYLDPAPARAPQAVAAITSCFGLVGNPSSVHAAGRRVRRVVEDAREGIAAALGAAPSEVLLTGGGTESDNLAVKGLFWARRAADDRRTRIVAGPLEHSAVRNALEWLAGEQGAVIDYVPVAADGVVTPDALRNALSTAPDTVALVTVMWGNNEVGSISPIRELAEVAHEYDVPFHTDAVQAVGQIPVSFAESGADALSLTGHKFGGPLGVGALLLRRGTPLTPLAHGGGHEHGLRAGTLDASGAAGLAAALKAAVTDVSAQAQATARLRDELVNLVRDAVPDVVLNGPDLDGPRLPGNASLSFPGCSGEELLLLLDQCDIACSAGSACSAGVLRPSGPARAWSQRGACCRHIALHPGAHDHDGGHRSGGCGHRWGRGAVPGGDSSHVHPADDGGRVMRVLAAMSGGVDSAVAAARAIDAGHDVTGVHLALSSAPAEFRTGSRGCCSVEDSHDARRAADVLGIPFYIWDLAEKFRQDVIEDFVAEYAAGRTPNPCLRCNEKIKFAAVLDRAIALGYDAVCTGHSPRSSTGLAAASCTGRLTRTRISPMSWVC